MFTAPAHPAAAADRASRKALELAPELADSHVARGHVHRVYRRYEESEREFQEAIRINPNSFDAAKLYALMSFEWGKIEQAAVWFRRGADIRLEDCQCSLLLAQTLRKLGRLDEALEAGREGYRRAERQLALQPDDARTLSLAATALYEDGQVERAHEMIRRALAVGSDDPGVLYNVGCTYASMGDKTEALRYLEQVFGIEGMGGRAWVETDPELDSLRDDPRFQRMVARLV